MIGSPEINKVLRRYLRPILIEKGFDRIEPRKAWGYRSPSIWTFNIRAVGSYFSDVTGWPPMSVGVNVGVYYEFIPWMGRRPLKADSKARLQPDVAVCHRRTEIIRSLDQAMYTSSLSLAPERARRDLWWIEEDGSNVADVVENIVICVLEQGIPWLHENSDIERTFSIVEGEVDCLVKYRTASGFAHYLGNAEKHEHYQRLADAESRRTHQQFAPFNRRRVRD